MLRLAVPRPVHPTSETVDSDWCSALDRVRDAAATLREADERIRELEARYEEIMQLTVEQLKAAQKKLDCANDRALVAEERARAADERSAADQRWLLQIQGGLEGLPRHAQSLRAVLGGRSSDDNPAEVSPIARKYG